MSENRNGLEKGSYRLRVIEGALRARLRELETRKRLPRGYSVKDLRDEFAALEEELLAIGIAQKMVADGVGLRPTVKQSDEPSFVGGGV